MNLSQCKVAIDHENEILKDFNGILGFTYKSLHEIPYPDILNNHEINIIFNVNGLIIFVVNVDMIISGHDGTFGGYILYWYADNRCLHKWKYIVFYTTNINYNMYDPSKNTKDTIINEDYSIYIINVFSCKSILKNINNPIYTADGNPIKCKKCCFTTKSARN